MFFRRGKSDEISILWNSEAKKTTLICWKVIGKCQISKSMEALLPLLPLRRSCTGVWSEKSRQINFFSIEQLLVAYCSHQFLYASFPNLNSTHKFMNRPALSLKEKIGWRWISLRCCTKDLATYYYDDVAIVSHNVFTPTRNAVWPKIRWNGRQKYRPVVKICRPVSPKFGHWAALKFCIALQNLLNFVVV